MNFRSAIRMLPAVALLLLLAPVSRAQDTEGPLPQFSGAKPLPPQPGQKVLTNADIVKMSNAQLGDALILQSIREQPGHYATGPDDLIALKNAGVSQPVISAMVAQTSRLMVHADAVKVTPLSPEVDEPGVYMQDKDGQWKLIEPEMVHYRDGGALKSLVTNNIVKKDLNGEVDGPKSTLKLSPGSELMILAPRGIDLNEYVILQFDQKGDRREFRVKTGGVFHSQTGVDRNMLDIPIHRVGNQVFAFTVPRDLPKGEYGVLPPGSASTPGIAHEGKVYTWEVTN